MTTNCVYNEAFDKLSENMEGKSINFYGYLMMLEDNIECSKQVYKLIVNSYKKEKNIVDSFKIEAKKNNSKSKNSEFSPLALANECKRQLDGANKDFLKHIRKVKAQMEMVLENWERDTNPSQITPLANHSKK